MRHGGINAGVDAPGSRFSSRCRRAGSMRTRLSQKMFKIICYVNCSDDPPFCKASRVLRLARHRLALPESGLLCVAEHRCGREHFCSVSCDWWSIDPNKPLQSDAVRVGGACWYLAMAVT